METNTYAVLLVDEYDTPYNTAITFTDKAIWDFIHTSPSALGSQSSVNVPLPAGYKTEDGETVANATSGSFTNDLAQYAVSLIDANGAEVVKELEFETNAEDDEEAGDGGDEWTRDAKTALAKLNIKPEHIYEGLWY